ncbi:MAG: hypothetical protein ACK5UM_09635 [Pseudomonadota bacterium]|jgi:hypothetical protein|nr:hypothetical protein [Rubrivivax sp.]MCA3260249.1 hypothetical protein [Rubrivivax sp.]MCZ8032856.1 hypothetical protein [Rubrivivax sp.]
MKLKLLLAATACAAGVAFAQVAPLSAGNAQKDRAVPGTDAHKWRAHEGNKGAAPVAKPAAGFEIQDLRTASGARPGVRASGPEEEPTQARNTLPSHAAPSVGSAVPAKPLTPQGPLLRAPRRDDTHIK